MTDSKQGNSPASGADMYDEPTFEPDILHVETCTHCGGAVTGTADLTALAAEVLAHVTENDYDPRPVHYVETTCGTRHYTAGLALAFGGEVVAISEHLMVMGKTARVHVTEVDGFTPSLYRVTLPRWEDDGDPVSDGSRCPVSEFAHDLDLALAYAQTLATHVINSTKEVTA